MEHLLAYISLSALMVIMPGADTILLIKNTLSYGHKAGISTMIGMVAGLLFWALLSILGLALVISNSMILFSLIKYLGALYLIYLGIKIILAKEMITFATDISKKTASLKHYRDSFMQAFLSNILNPKTILVYLTIMPQFISFNENVNVQLIKLVLIFIMIAMIWFIALVYLINYSKKWLTHSTPQKILQFSASITLIGFGIKTGLGS